LTNIFAQGLKTDQVEMSIILAKQFHSLTYYTRAMMNTMEVLLRAHTMLNTGHLLCLLEAAGSMRDNLSPLLVDTLVKWMSPIMDRKKEVMLAVGAKNLIKQTGLTNIFQSYVSGYKLVFAQVRVVLLVRQQIRLGEKERFVV
jgi:hypothetical protein